MPNLNLNTIELVSTLRPAPFQGSPSTLDYNDSQNETLLDLTALSAFVNNVLIPMLVALPDNAISGLEGRSIYGDSTDQTSLFYDATTGQSLTLSDAIRQLNALVLTSNLTVGNLEIQVGQLQQKLSSTNQNNIATTLQNLTNSINTITSQQQALDSAITAIQTSGVSSSNNTVSNIKTNRGTFTIPANSQTTLDLLWQIPFVDNNYIVNASSMDATGSCIVNGFSYIGTGNGVGVLLTNPTANAVSVVINVIAIPIFQNSQTGSLPSNLQTARGSFTIPANSVTVLNLNWTNSFVDNNYTATLSLMDPTGSCIIDGYNYVASGAGIQISVKNNTANAVPVVANAIGIHD